MNSIERQECETHLGTSDGVTMEDYFDHIIARYPILERNELKQKLKDSYPNESEWSF